MSLGKGKVPKTPRRRKEKITAKFLVFVRCHGLALFHNYNLYEKYMLTEDEAYKVHFVINQLRAEFAGSLTQADYYELTKIAIEVLEFRGRVHIMDLRLNAQVRALMNAALGSII